MSRRIQLFGAAALAAMVAAVPASAVTLKAAYFVYPKHAVGLGYQYLADEIERETKGDVKIRIFPGESLLAAKAISDGVRDEVADIGHVVMTYTPPYYPHGIVLNDLAMVGPDDMAGAMAVTELYMLHCPTCLEDSAKQNQVFFSGTSTPASFVIAKGDFNSVEKIKTKKLRAAGSLWDRFCQSIGAVAVNMPTAGMYEAISRGTIDGALYAIGGLKSHGLGDVATQIIKLNTGSFRSVNLFSMNMDSWSKLSVEERAAFLRVLPRAVVRTTAAYQEADADGYAVAKEKNIPIVEPDPELLRLRNEFVEKDQEVTIANARDNLHLADAAEFVGNYKKLYDKYEKLIAPIATDEAKLGELLYQEVYSKIDPAKFGVK
ncbi:MAG: C4-dicarboxylate TRAP transporter substrate-binding protein [Proteobacteria bacterium]|nr:C4-dicarboxylate TRAP transporter substrate-binding protein [Pseudomonadota bacterium]